LGRWRKRGKKKARAIDFDLLMMPSSGERISDKNSTGRNLFASTQWQSFVVNDEEAFGGAISLPRVKVKGHAFH